MIKTIKLSEKLCLRQLHKLKKGLSGLFHCESGAVLVEYMLTLPIYLLFFFGVLSVSLVLLIQVNMENAARDSAQLMAISEATGSGTPVSCTSITANTAGTAEYYACSYLADWPVDFQVDADDLCPVREVAVTITVPKSDAALADILNFFTDNLNAKITIRREEACP